jgi:subtilisin family serine protease
MNSIRALLLLAVLILSFPTAAALPPEPPNNIVWTGNTTGVVGYRTDRFLIAPADGVTTEQLEVLHSVTGSAVLSTYRHSGNMQLVACPPGAEIDAVMHGYKDSGMTASVWRDYLMRDIQASEPDDPYYTDGTLWALNNTGQNGGKPDADIDAPEAWAVQPNAEGVVVAIVDNGVRYTHEDLADTMWTNPPEDLNHNHKFEKWPSSEQREGVKGDLDGIDNDANGYVDDVIGWDFGSYNNTRDNDPYESSQTYSHGTECAGIVAGVANNGKGTVGVAPGARIMPVKCSQDGWSYVSDNVAALDYAVMMHPDIISYSSGFSENFDSGPFGTPVTALYNPCAAARSSGIIVAACAQNYNTDLGDEKYYPAAYSDVLDNVVSVAATDRRDRMACYSNYSTRYVQIAAPAVDTWSCTSSADNAYGPFGGTSSATPHVSGALALLKAAYPTESYRKLIGRLLSGVDPSPFLEEICSSGGRLNVYKALTNPRNDLRVMPVSGVELAYSDPTVSPSSRTKTYTLWNDGDAALAWSAATGEAWFSVTPSSGSLAPGASSQVTVAFNDGVRTLANGPHRSTLVFDTTQGGVSRDVVVYPGVMHVRPDGNDDSDGSTWALAKKTIQAAVDASKRDQEIWVAGGTYTENVEIGRGVALFGGFAGTETSRDQRNWKTNPTLLNGSVKGSVVLIRLRTAAPVILDGFTVHNGSGSSLEISTTTTLVNLWGGGICAWGCPLVVRNCVVRDNACYYGGGLRFC